MELKLNNYGVIPRKQGTADLGIPIEQQAAFPNMCHSEPVLTTFVEISIVIETSSS